MTNNHVTPAVAVEAARAAFYAHEKGTLEAMDASIQAALEAAAPHMLAPRTYSIEDVAAEFGIDLDELRKAAD